MALLMIECESLEQAQLLAEFYERMGEQIANEWMSNHDMKAPFTDVCRPEGWKHVDLEMETVTVFTK
jgi:hypothetical protein